uniref:Uncharacterized protein n=1 Tax=Palpitomonas bilix TaxID=652834 RepID=A0A7S3D9I0_9EUKA|mmetsp:Transcript_27988/g.71223  ORF Transcript_27988/g.71223 Transcript_27988/m.71223 type:complete len:288 (+) Transcript_27988:395-1258(+)
MEASPQRPTSAFKCILSCNSNDKRAVRLALRQIEGYKGLEATLLYLFPEIRFRKYKVYYREYHPGEREGVRDDGKGIGSAPSPSVMGQYELPALEMGERFSAHTAAAPKRLKWQRLTLDGGSTNLPCGWDRFADDVAEIQVCYEHDAEAKLMKRNVAGINYRYGKISIDALERTEGALPRIERKRMSDQPVQSRVGGGGEGERAAGRGEGSNEVEPQAKEKSNVVKQGFRLRRVRKTMVDQSLFGDSHHSVSIPAVAGNTNIGVSMISGSVQHRLNPQGGYGALLPR